MDMQSIEDEINEFNSRFFKDIEDTVEEGLDFINNNRLHQPKENYTILFNYLNLLYTHFKTLDYNFIGTTLPKLYADIKYLTKLHKELQKRSENINEIFQKLIITRSPVLMLMQKEVHKYKSIHNISIEDKKILKKHIRNFEKLKQLYLESFKMNFTADRDYFLFSILKILNTKTYYLEKLLWIQVSQSPFVMKTLKDINSKEEINSKIYLTHKLSVIMPYSDEYRYLQKCLRIFK